MTMYVMEDAASAIAELIEEEQGKIEHAENSDNPRQRDIHRATTSILAYKQALKLLLLERKCEDGKAHEMPDVEEYLGQRRGPTV